MVIIIIKIPKRYHERVIYIYVYIKLYTLLFIRNLEHQINVLELDSNILKIFLIYYRWKNYYGSFIFASVLVSISRTRRSSFLLFLSSTCSVIEKLKEED